MKKVLSILLGMYISIFGLLNPYFLTKNENLTNDSSISSVKSDSLASGIVTNDGITQGTVGVKTEIENLSQTSVKLSWELDFPVNSTPYILSIVTKPTNYESDYAGNPTSVYFYEATVGQSFPLIGSVVIENLMPNQPEYVYFEFEYRMHGSNSTRHELSEPIKFWTSPIITSFRYNASLNKDNNLILSWNLINLQEVLSVNIRDTIKGELLYSETNANGHVINANDSVSIKLDESRTYSIVIEISVLDLAGNPITLYSDHMSITSNGVTTNSIIIYSISSLILLLILIFLIWLLLLLFRKKKQEEVNYYEDDYDGYNEQIGYNPENYYPQIEDNNYKNNY